jgi:hypothetical protein
MPNPDHFQNRATAYRQAAEDSNDEWIRGNMFEISSLFSAMADDLSRRIELQKIKQDIEPRVSVAILDKLPSWSWKFSRLPSVSLGSGERAEFAAPTPRQLSKLLRD